MDSDDDIDSDDDNDGVSDNVDECPLGNLGWGPSAPENDADGDCCEDDSAEDLDDDNDSFNDDLEIYYNTDPLNINEYPNLDSDGDGVPFSLGFPISFNDNCPDVANPDQSDIDEDGLKLPGITISTDNSSPRELVVLNDKVYFTNWNSKDVKVLNLYNYVIEASIQVDGLPESIKSDGSSLWVGIMMNEDYSSANKVVEINTSTNEVINIYEVGLGPTDLVVDDGKIYVARTFYDENFTAFYGSSKIDGNIVEKKDYGLGISCGGSVLKYNNQIYRSYEGGIAPLETDLEIRSTAKIGSYEPSQVYSIEIIDEYIYFGITNYSDLNQVKVIDENGNEINSFEVGIIPGDFAIWKSE